MQAQKGAMSRKPSADYGSLRFQEGGNATLRLNCACSERILRTYLAPESTFHWVESIASYEDDDEDEDDEQDDEEELEEETEDESEERESEGIEDRETGMLQREKKPAKKPSGFSLDK
jgi:hypothetical protein